ncbi:MAG: phytoene desaturase [Flavobacteriales bacterium]|nr:phytoene desaturase [Flavobacteriales bacterium]
MRKNKKCLVLGAGFAGLSCASLLAKNGFDVTLIDKHSQAGGRCRAIEEQGFLFDLGPSWYWMPDVFERFYNQFGYTTKDLYDLKHLNPSYQVIFEDETIGIPSDFEELKKVFEQHEKGSSKQLEKFIDDAKYKYEKGMSKLVYKPSLSLLEYLDVNLLKDFFQLDLFSSISSSIKKYFKNPKLIELLEFPVLFLGAKPNQTPALYSLMNYADIKLGTWYPIGGMSEVSNAFRKIAEEQGVKIHLGENVLKIESQDDKVKRVVTNKNEYNDFDYVISAMDYHHTESILSNQKTKNYSESYWKKRKLAPSCFLYYLGVDKKLKNLEHHNLFFDADFSLHSEEIYDTKKLPSKPLFYVCAPSVTDNKVAPEGKENIFILIPIATGINETDEDRDKYLNDVLERLENKTQQKIKEHIIYKKSFATRDFISEYNSYQGNAYGLANTLNQTAILKPRIKNNKLKNLFYCGQMSVPGPGVPPSIISGEIVANYINNQK